VAALTVVRVNKNEKRVNSMAFFIVLYRMCNIRKLNRKVFTVEKLFLGCRRLGDRLWGIVLKKSGPKAA
jgi:hypothetical protein